MHQDSTTRSARTEAVEGDAGAGRWLLHVLVTPDPGLRGRRIAVPPHGIVIGRGQDADVTVADGELSRAHVALRPDESGAAVELRDQASRNGTFSAGRPVCESSLGDGAVLRFGRTVAVLEHACTDSPEHDAPTPQVPGRSARAAQVRGDLAKAAASPLPVLLQGATGTGKERAAEAIHQQSGRSGRLVRLNIAALPRELFEAELFGHAKGAFSGAAHARLGYVREADGGTLVLDEIGELSLDLQTKLLRTIEDRRVRPLGSPADVACDVRFVAATNVDLADQVAQGRFRRDLFMRLQLCTVHLPPVCDRRADLMDLCDAVEPLPGARWADRIDALACEALLVYGWPGNLRELRAALLAVRGAKAVGVERLPQDVARAWRVRRGELQEAGPAPDLRKERAWTRPATRAGKGGADGRPTASQLTALLCDHAGNVEAVAQALGRDRRQVYRWLQKAGVALADLARFRGRDPVRGPGHDT